MPFNIYTFVLSEKLASDEFAKRGVTDQDSVRRTALIAGFLSPANGGINGAVVPAIIAKEKASRDADAAVVTTPRATTPTPPPTGPTGIQPGPPATPDPVALNTRLTTVESAFAPYGDFVTKKVGDAKNELEKNFVVVVKDETGAAVPDTPPETPILAQQPDPKTTTQLAKGVTVALIVKKK